MLVDALRMLGVEQGMIVLVHTSLSRLGFIPGAQRAVVEALLATVGPEGTLVMPTFSGELSDPAEWRYPPVPDAWIAPIRAETPPYDEKLTPTRRMGSVAEYFRNCPDVLRSAHPQSSFAAVGRRARDIVDGHGMDFRFGPDSPLGRLYDAGGQTLMLGAPLQTNSMLYLTQHRLGSQVELEKSAPVSVGGQVTWKRYRDFEYTNHWFEDAAAFLLEAGIARRGTTGDAVSHLFPIRATVDAVSDWRRANGV